MNYSNLHTELDLEIDKQRDATLVTHIGSTTSQMAA